MRLGEDVGVDAQGKAGRLAESFGTGGDEVEFGGRLYVKEEDASFQGGVDLVRLLADSGEDSVLDCGLGGLEDAGEFAARDDVETSAVVGQKTHEGQRGVRLEGVADGVGDGSERFLKECQAREDVLLGVDVERGSVGLGEFGEGHGVTGELAIPVCEGTRIWGGLKLSFGNRTVLGAGCGALR